MRGRIHQLSVSNGGVPKRAVPEADVSVLGLTGDVQAKRKIHGGPERAVCLFSLEVIRALQNDGHAIDAGTTGENVTIEGVDWAALAPGARLRLGAHVVVEVSDYAPPCRSIMRFFVDRKFGAISQKRHAGRSRLYACVLVPGRVRVGDDVTSL